MWEAASNRIKSGEAVGDSSITLPGVKRGFSAFDHTQCGAGSAMDGGYGPVALQLTVRIRGAWSQRRCRRRYVPRTVSRGIRRLRIMAGMMAHARRRRRKKIVSLRDISSTQWKCGLAAWLGWFFDGLDMHLYTLVATPFVAAATDGRHPRRSTCRQKSSWIQAAFLVGWALGGGFFGRIGDRLGRSRALMLTILTYALFTGLSFFAQTWWHLLILPVSWRRSGSAANGRSGRRCFRRRGRRGGGIGLRRCCRAA